MNVTIVSYIHSRSSHPNNINMTSLELCAATNNLHWVRSGMQAHRFGTLDGCMQVKLFDSLNLCWCWRNVTGNTGKRLTKACNLLCTSSLSKQTGSTLSRPLATILCHNLTTEPIRIKYSCSVNDLFISIHKKKNMETLMFYCIILFPLPFCVPLQ